MKKKKSDSSRCSAESEALGLDLKVQMIQRSRGKNLGFNKNIDEVPTLSQASWEHNNLLVSSQMTMTNMPVKSTGQDSAEVNSSKAISEKSPHPESQIMTSSQVDFPVKVFPLRENVKVFRTEQEELFSMKSAESYEIKDQATYSLKMLRDYFLTTRDEPLQSYCFRWMNLGTISNGRCATLNIGCPKTGKGSLSSVLEEKVDERYYLSEKMIDYLKKNAGDNWPKEEISDQISATDYKGPSKQRMNVIHKTSGQSVIIKQEEIGTLQAGGSNVRDKTPNIIKDKKIRRITPTECERLQGFPDGWTEGCSDTQRYKQMGNAVSVPVIEAIGRKILEAIKCL